MADQKTHKVTLIPGDGIGPEVTQAVLRILEATGVKFEWERFAAGAEAFEIFGEYIPAALYQSIERNGVALKGPVTTPIGGGFKSINVTLRKKFDLFANFRPVKNLPGLATHWPGVDLIIVRENTEGEYVGLEHEVVPGVVESIKVITEKGSTRIAKFAFEYARKHGRKKIHSVHKANIMKLSDGLFLRCARQVAEGFPDVAYAEHLIDNTCMQLVMNPYQYDTLLLENLYGDIVSDLCAGLVGGLGLVPGANLGLNCAIFEAVHGSAPGHRRQGHRQPHGAVAVRSADAAPPGRAASRQARCSGLWRRSTPSARRSPATWAARPAPASLPTPCWRPWARRFAGNSRRERGASQAAERRLLEGKKRQGTTSVVPKNADNKDTGFSPCRMFLGASPCMRGLSAASSAPRNRREFCWPEIRMIPSLIQGTKVPCSLRPIPPFTQIGELPVA